MQKSLLIKNVTLVPMSDSETAIENGYIYVEDGKITATGSIPFPEQYNQATKIIDGEGMVAIPGLINGHTHTPMSILRGYEDNLPLMKWLQSVWEVEGRMSPEDMYWGSMLSMAEMIKAGITTFSDMYFNMDKIAAGVEKTGMRALLAEGIIENENVDAYKVLEENVSFVKQWNGAANNRITALFAPHAPYTTTPKLLEKIVEEAHKLDCSIHTHLAETRDEINIIKERYGETPIALMEKVGLFTRHVIAAHCVHLTEEEFEIVQNNQVGVIHNPKSNMKLASGVAPIARFLQNGVTVGLGTDGSASNNVLDLFEEMRFASLLQKVNLEDSTILPAYQTLEMGTSQGAKALGLGEQVGTIEIGKQADITLVNLKKTHVYPVNDVISHLIYSVKAEDVAYTLVDGEILLDNGKLTTIDEEEVFWHMDKITTKLL